MCSHLLCIRRDADGQYQSQAGKRDFCSNCCLLDAVEGSSGSTCLCAGTVPTCAHHDDPFPSRTRALPGCPAWEMKSALNGKCNQAGPAREEKGQQKKNKFRSWNGKKKKLNAVCTAVPVTPSTRKTMVGKAGLSHQGGAERGDFSFSRISASTQSFFSSSGSGEGSSSVLSPPQPSRAAGRGQRGVS